MALASDIRYRKSQLAIEHCYRTAEQSLETWVFWAHASNPARLEQSFREIADHVKIRGAMVHVLGDLLGVFGGNGHVAKGNDHGETSGSGARLHSRF